MNANGSLGGRDMPGYAILQASIGSVQASDIAFAASDWQKTRPE